MHRGKETRYVLADDAPPPFHLLTISMAFPLLKQKVDVGMALVFATHTMAADAFL